MVIFAFRPFLECSIRSLLPTEFVQIYFHRSLSGFTMYPCAVHEPVKSSFRMNLEDQIIEFLTLNMLLRCKSGTFVLVCAKCCSSPSQYGHKHHKPLLVFSGWPLGWHCGYTESTNSFPKSLWVTVSFFLSHLSLQMGNSYWLLTGSATCTALWLLEMQRHHLSLQNHLGAIYFRW